MVKKPNYKQDKKRREEAQKKRNAEEQERQSARKRVRCSRVRGPVGPLTARSTWIVRPWRCGPMARVGWSEPSASPF